METRTFSLMDRLIGEIDKAIKVLSVPVRASRALPAASVDAQILSEHERLESSRLLRVNHAGEVAAQALYQGQAFNAHSSEISNAMRHCAAEEMDHLAWCEQRLGELKGRTSLLNPLWYAGSFAIGALAGSLGDSASLGFITETEKQVAAHLKDHLQRLPSNDARSRAILQQMTHDEIEHGSTAASLGGKALPWVLRLGMRLVSRVMTRSAYWL